MVGIPEALLVGTTEGPRPESPEALAEPAEAPSAVTETPEAVDTEIPEPALISGGCCGGRLRADAGAVSTRGA